MHRRPSNCDFRSTTDNVLVSDQQIPDTAEGREGAAGPGGGGGGAEGLRSHFTQPSAGQSWLRLRFPNEMTLMQFQSRETAANCLSTPETDNEILDLWPTH